MESQRKVVIVGAGAVGSTFAYTLMRSGLAREIVLIDLDHERAEGEAMDMNHGLFFAPPVSIRAGDYSECEGASIVVVTAGAKQKPGQTRLQLVQSNVRVCRTIMGEITKHTQDAVVLMVTNPVDVLTYFAVRESGLPRGAVLGSGTVLDSSRFRYLLSRYYRVDPRNVHAYIVGEHGDSEVALWSMAHIGGLPLDSYCDICKNRVPPFDRAEVLRQVRESAYHVIESKGATYYAVSLALERIVEAMCLSLPCVVNRSGVERVMQAPFSDDEIEGLRHSAGVLREIIEQVQSEDSER